MSPRSGPGTGESLSDVMSVCATGRPLCESVRESLDAYFDALDGHETSGLYQMVLREVERPLLQTVLERTGNNQSNAAQILGISRGTLRKKLKEYGL